MFLLEFEFTFRYLAKAFDLYVELGEISLILLLDAFSSDLKF